jgi:hypothetical protein
MRGYCRQTVPPSDDVDVPPSAFSVQNPALNVPCIVPPLNVTLYEPTMPDAEIDETVTVPLVADELTTCWHCASFFASSADAVSLMPPSLGPIEIGPTVYVPGTTGAAEALVKLPISKASAV